MGGINSIDDIDRMSDASTAVVRILPPATRRGVANVLIGKILSRCDLWRIIKGCIFLIKVRTVGRTWTWNDI